MVLFGSKTLECNPGKHFSKLYTHEGMYEGQPSKAPVITLSASDTTSFFMPGTELVPPGAPKPPACTGLPKILGFDFSCCFLTLESAASCRAKALGQRHFMVHSNGTATAKIGAFEIDIEYSQSSALPVIYSDDLSDGYL